MRGNVSQEKMCKDKENIPDKLTERNLNIFQDIKHVYFLYIGFKVFLIVSHKTLDVLRFDLAILLLL